MSFAEAFVHNEKQQKAHESIERRPQHDGIIHSLREEPSLLAAGRGYKEFLGEFLPEECS